MRTNRAIRLTCLTLIAALTLGAPLSGCDSGDSGWSTDIRDAENPLGERTLSNLEESEIVATLQVTRSNINKARPQGIQKLLTVLRKDLVAAGIDDTPLDSVSDDDVGKPLPGSGLPQADTGTGGTGTGSTPSQPIEAAKYYDCPILAPEDNTGTSCDQLVNAALAKVLAQMQQQKPDIEQDTGLPTVGQDFVAAWADEAQKHGAQVAAIYAAGELRAAAKCDSKVNGMMVAYQLGVDQGTQIVVGYRPWALAQVTTCVVNTDAIAAQVEVMSLADVDGFMKDNPVCEDADLSAANKVLVDAENKRKEGIEQGIDQRVEVLRTELFQARATAPCPTGGGGGEPLVIDLDDDGVQMSGERVRFDLLANGNRQSVTWVGPREGFVALDLDGNGAIDSAAELMSDRCECQGQRCYDGVAALSAYDRVERGGNGDGMIDKRDRVYPRLLLWVDSNQDGESQSAELAPLADHGIRAINLQADQTMNYLRGATLTAELSVLTDGGFLRAYDAWFQMKIGTGDLASLMPER